jgi:pimeloyl-ACP methyl ester carboxylesterase
VVLSLLAVGGGRLCYPLLLRTGNDDPKALRSDRATRLRRPDGTELRIEEFGKQDGPAIVLTHGWGMDSSEWYYVKKHLAQDYRVVVWDLPGLGRSTRAANNDYELPRLAHDLQAVVEWTQAPQIVLVGHSIGGMTLQTYARLYPVEPRVRGLALVHTTHTNPLRTTRFAALYSAIETPVIVPLLYLTIGLSPLVWLMNVLSYLNGSAHQSAHRQSFSGAESRGQLNFVARYVPQDSPAVLARGMLAMLRFDESQSVRQITTPTAVVAAQRDPVTLPQSSRYLATNIPRSAQVELPAARHQGHLEFHAGFVDSLRGFVRKSLGTAE